MTQTLTTEQLRARAESFGLDFIIENRSGIWVKEWFNNGCTMATAEEVMLWSMLANREAQPVAYLHHSGQVVTREECCDDEIFAICCKVETPLYTAPPAPAVSIPDKVSCEGFDPKDWVEARNLGQCEGWNAYRAELLAHHVIPGKLPPHAYRELVNSLRDTAVKYSGTDQLRERLNTTLSQFIEPDHPHTRTAAPDSV